MRKKQTIWPRILILTVVALSTLFWGSSCRQGSDAAPEPVVTDQAAPVSDANEASSLPQNHEAYTAAVQNLGQKTSAAAATLFFIKPGSGQTFRRGTRIEIEAQSQERRELRQVTFFVNGRRIGVSSSNPYRTSWWAKDRGRFVITVEGTRRGGDRTASSTSIVIE
jgi:hypothetical protein